MKLAWVRPAMMRARVVFPTPGGPQKIMEEMRSWSINCRKIFPSPKVLLPDKFLRVLAASGWPMAGPSHLPKEGLLFQDAP